MQVGDLLTFGDLVIDQDAWEVRLRGAVINFTRTEFELLLAIASRPRRVVTDEELTRQLWGDGWIGDDGNLAVHVSKLRSKLGESGVHQRYIRTIRGVGYRFDPYPDGNVDGASESYLRLLRRSDSVEVSVTPDLVIVELDTELSNVFGWAPSELIGRVLPFIGDEYLRDPEVAGQVVESLASRGVTSWSGSRSVPHADGHSVRAEFATHVTFGPDGKVEGIRFVFVTADGHNAGTVGD